MNLGPAEIGLILLAVMVLFGYKKLPDASRSLGRSLRIFKGEMSGMSEDDAARMPAPSSSAPQPPATPSTAVDLEAEAAAAEAAALEARARAARAARARADAQHRVDAG